MDLVREEKLKMARKRKKRISLGDVEDKTGRMDCFLFGLTRLGAQHLEKRLGMSGLWDTVSPIVDDLIQDNVDSERLVSEEFREVIQNAARIRMHGAT